MSEDPIDGNGDALAETEPAEGREQPDDVDVGDPFLAALDHVWAGPAGPGFAIAGYDANDDEIGRISVYPLGPETLRITHRYPRQCLIDNSGEVDPSEDCVDVLYITVSLAGDPNDHWHDVYQTLPANVLLQRMQAMQILFNSQPQETAKDLHCALSVAATAAACTIGSPTYPLGGAIVCSGLVWNALCSCKEHAQEAFPDLDMDKICD